MFSHGVCIAGLSAACFYRARAARPSTRAAPKAGAFALDAPPANVLTAGGALVVLDFAVVAGVVAGVAGVVTGTGAMVVGDGVVAGAGAVVQTAQLDDESAAGGAGAGAEDDGDGAGTCGGAGDDVQTAQLLDDTATGVVVTGAGADEVELDHGPHA